MSITFFAPESPIKSVHMAECYCVIDGKKDPDCTNCDDNGLEQVEVPCVPEMNVSNANAFALQEVIGLVPDYAGCWEKEDLGDIRQRIMRAINSEQIRNQALQAPSDTRTKRIGKTVEGFPQITMGVRVVEKGRSESYILARLGQLQETIMEAQRLGLKVCWG